MAIDFLAMLQEQKKQQEKEAQKTSKEQKKKTSANTPKKEKTPVAKATAPKKETFEEQYSKINNSYVKIVVDHLLTLDGMKEKMESQDVSISDMWKYITTQARKEATNGCAMVSDEVVYGWGRHYYDENGKVA